MSLSVLVRQKTAVFERPTDERRAGKNAVELGVAQRLFAPAFRRSQLIERRRNPPTEIAPAARMSRVELGISVFVGRVVNARNLRTEVEARAVRFKFSQSISSFGQTSRSIRRQRSCATRSGSRISGGSELTSRRCFCASRRIASSRAAARSFGVVPGRLTPRSL